jgi:hypothetical protein
MGEEMDIIFQSALTEALRYGYIALNLLVTRARQAAKERARRRSKTNSMRSNAGLCDQADRVMTLSPRM